MKIPFNDLRLQYHSIKEEVEGAILDVIENSAFIGGAKVKEFEEDFANFCRSKYCIGVGNGTDALFIALKMLGIEDGDEVITTANSFIATSEAITGSGAKVVFVDIDPKTYNIDVSKIEEKITNKTKAIIPVHIYGQPTDMDNILEPSKRHNLKIIEDCAQAHGAEYKGRRVGTLGDIGCFSFYPGKNLGAYGDAGAIVTDNRYLADQCRMFANHGRISKYDHEFEGINSRLDGLQAAILNVKLRYLEKWTESRIKNAKLYNKYLKDSPVITPTEIDRVKSVYHLYVIRVDENKCKPLIDFLAKEGVSTGIHYPTPLPNLIAYNYLGYKDQSFPIAQRYSKEYISLPMYPELNEDQIRYITDLIKEFLK